MKISFKNSIWGLAEWVFDKPEERKQIKTADGQDLFEACAKAYDGVHAMIKAGEYSAYAATNQSARSYECNILPYDEGLDYHNYVWL